MYFLHLSAILLQYQYPAFMKNLLSSFLLLLLFNPCFAQYNFYFGNIHAHSGYSDGNKDSITSGSSRPADNYSYAKDSYHFDFLGISEHNHYLAGMKSRDDYHSGLQQADTSNQDGSFVCLYGMEWGVISNGGHVVIYGVDSLIGWDTLPDNITPDYDIYCYKYDYNGLWNILKQKPGCFATLAHPDTYDYDSLNQRSYNNNSDLVVTGVAVRSGSAFSVTTDYSDAPPSTSESFFKKMLAKGYRVAPTIDHDNHYTNFGRANTTRTVVLARSLLRDSILDAYRHMRFYASDDWNTQLNFTVNGNYMGSDVVSFNNSSIDVSISDPDVGDDVSKIDLYYGVPGSGVNATKLTTVSGASSLNYVHATSAGETFYYYAKVTQVDGDILWSAPVWISRTAVLPVNIISFTGKAISEKIRTEWMVAQETDMSFYTVEKSMDGQSYAAIGTITARNVSNITYHFDDPDPQNGLQFYRLKQVGRNGAVNYSQIITVNYKKELVTFISLYPDPVKSTLYYKLNSSVKGDITIRTYSSEGRLLQQDQRTLHDGENNLSSKVNNLTAGYYYLVLYFAGRRIAETAFIKQ